MTQNSNSSASLRGRLRTDTRDLHERLDADVARLDLCARSGLGAFLQLQQQGFGSLLGDLAAGAGGISGIDPAPTLRADLRRLLDAVERDLKLLGTPPLTPDPQSPTASPTASPIADGFQPLAVAYLLYGSRAGASLLRRDWEKATDPRVRMARSFFTMTPSVAAWTHLRDGLDAMPADNARADAIVASARRAFEVFIAVAQQLTAPLNLDNGVQESFHTPDQSAPATAPAQSGQTLSGSGLVVEDDTIISLDTAELLQSMGAETVHCATSVQQARQIMDQTDISFAVLDVKLRGETSAALAHLLHRSQVPYVLASGDCNDGQRVEGYPDSIVVSKPYNMSTLRDGLQTAFGEIRNLRATAAT